MCRKDPAEAKQDLPFANDAAIAAMVAEFEAGRWPFARWSHRCHLAVGAWYLRRMPFADALVTVRDSIQRYNARCGSGMGYHETITQLFLRAIHERLRDDRDSPLASLVDELARTRTMDWVSEHYSKDRLAMREAIEGWIGPDLKPLA